MKNKVNEGETRYCKKCGCELVSTNTHKLCDNCRHTRNAKIRTGVIGGVSTALGLFTIVFTHGKNGGNKE